MQDRLSQGLNAGETSKRNESQEKRVLNQILAFFAKDQALKQG
jgi:hypothetical protein